MRDQNPANLQDSQTATPTEQSSRSRILRAAMAEFASEGLAGARVDRIAQAAGVNKAMIYYHFSSKRALYRTCFEELLSGVIARLQTALDGIATLEQRLEALADNYAHLFLENPVYVALLLRELAEPESEVVKQLADLMKQSGVPALVTGALERGIESGQARPVDARQALVTFVAANLGYFILAPLMDRVLDIPDRSLFLKDRPKAVTDLILNGVRPR